MNPDSSAFSDNARHHRPEDDAAPEFESDELDVRGLPPPEPMIAILEVAAELAPGDTMIARTDRQPIFLLPELERRGLGHRSEELPDGSWRTVITRA